MEPLRAALILIFAIVSFRFYVKFGQYEHAEIIAHLTDYESTECPFGISLYRLKTFLHAYRIQVQRKLPHDLKKERGILRRCEKEVIDNVDGAGRSRDQAEDLTDYQAVSGVAAGQLDGSCHAGPVQHGDDGQSEWSPLGGSLTTNPVFAYLLEVVKWPDPPVVASPRSEAEAWSIATLSRGVFPGTLWCGFGNVADDTFGLLGEHSETDACCRSHDLCKPIIRAFQTRFYYSNPSVVPISHCGCDLDFYNCLLKVNSPTSRMIGNIFFNLVKMKCFDFDVRSVCTSSFLGLCRGREKKCVAVLKNNKLFPTEGGNSLN